MEQDVLLRATDLTKYFPVTKGLVLQKIIGWVQAVDHINFTIRRGETLALVGESGCGKTTTAKLILRLERPTTGQISLENSDVHQMEGEELKQYHTDVQAVFQDPWSSLSPRMRVRDIISEALVVNQKVTKVEAYDRVDYLLTQVGLRTQQSTLYPHEFSGGQRQRLALAAALVGNPKLICLDEPVSALDVSIQAQIINLLKDLQESFGVGYLLVAHNLATVRYLANEVAVMYLGEIVEQAETNELYDNTLHPYTKALFSAALTANPDSQREEIILRGEVPSPINPPSGCRFHVRCPYAMDICSQEIPVRKEMAPGHFVNCHLY
ncbi:MAG: ATP-binding cassette domain-containing protein [Chloroflexota bacterium]|nr:ATP-binding cassette domain-containing protein [Chloroflexota bacterium]